MAGYLLPFEVALVARTCPILDGGGTMAIHLSEVGTFPDGGLPTTPRGCIFSEVYSFAQDSPEGKRLRELLFLDTRRPDETFTDWVLRWLDEQR